MLIFSDKCGWVFFKIASPCVAHRVCAMPVVILVNDFSFVLRFFIGPVALIVVSFDEISDPEIPDESYPLYSSFIRP